MPQPYVGEVRIFAGNFAPLGWMFCEGQLLPISENDTLFNLIGTTYGGDGQSTFALPDLRGRLPLHIGNGYTLGESGGVEEVTLTAGTIPQHTHQLCALTKASTSAPSGTLLGANPDASLLSFGLDGGVPGSPTLVTPVGGGQAHDNLQPYLCINFIISMFGIYPSQT
jgi:microcystin-dependent protein